MPSSIDTIDLDVLLSERFVETTTTTDHPVEEGSDPTDHVRVLPGRLTLEAMITNTPTVEGDRTQRGDPTFGTPGFAGQQYEKLRALRFGKAVVVTTPARRYVDMQLTQIARSRDSKIGVDAVQFTCEFKEVFFVSTQSVQLERVTAIPQKPTKKETQAKKPTTEEEDDRSELKKLTDAGGITNQGKGRRPK